MAILGQHTGHPVIGTSTWTISHQPRPMNITWRLISPHSHSWVTSKIGPVSLNTHRSTVCIQNSLPSWGSQFWFCGEKLSFTLSSWPGPRPLWQLHWWMVTRCPGVCWPGLIMQMPGISPGSPDHQHPLAAHLSQARLLSPHSAFLKYSGISKLSKVNPDQGLPRIS